MINARLLLLKEYFSFCGSEWIAGDNHINNNAATIRESTIAKGLMRFISDALARKLRTRFSLDESDIRRLESMFGPPVPIDKGIEIIYEGQVGQPAYVLHEGWTCSLKRLSDGTRQIVDVQIPGDFVGLRGVLLKTSDLSFETLTGVQVSRIHMDRVVSGSTAASGLGLTLLTAISMDEAMILDHLVKMIRGDAMQKTVHFLLKLRARMSLIGQANADGYACPLSQGTLADVLGITPIHLNRVLRQLREAGLLKFRDGYVSIFDYEKLKEIDDFDDRGLAIIP
jgi:CRP-like cAMP-binding protein